VAHFSFLNEGITIPYNKTMTKKKLNNLPTIPNAVFDPELAKKFEEASKVKGDIKAFVEDFIMQFVSTETQKAYNKDLQFFFDFLRSGGQFISGPADIKSHHFRIYRDFLIDRNYSSATINRRLVCIRSFIKWAMASKLIDHNPLDQIKMPRTQTETPTQAFDDEEVIDMITAPDLNTKMGLCHRMVIVMLFSLGLRRSELVKIKLCDFYRERGHLVLRIKGKGSKYRDMPVPKYVAREMRDYLTGLEKYNINLEQDDYLIQSQKIGKNTSPMDGSTVFRIVTRYAKMCGINKRVSPHSCRATAISHLLDTQKTPIRDVAIFAGHAKITTTEAYDKRRKGLDENAAYQVDYHKGKEAS
jgi:integrase/recombinase XerD